METYPRACLLTDIDQLPAITRVYHMKVSAPVSLAELKDPGGASGIYLMSSRVDGVASIDTKCTRYSVNKIMVFIALRSPFHKLREFRFPSQSCLQSDNLNAAGPDAALNPNRSHTIKHGISTSAYIAFDDSLPWNVPRLSPDEVSIVDACCNGRRCKNLLQDIRIIGGCWFDVNILCGWHIDSLEHPVTDTATMLVARSQASSSST
jgi:hypothetical protein